MKVFLGGTVSNSVWRNYIKPKLEVDYFDPVVEDWDDEAYQRELYERKFCDFCLYVISPKMVGYYALAEVVDDSFKRPDRTLYCYLPDDDGVTFDESEILALEKVGKIVEFNGGLWYKSIDEIIEFLNSANTLKDSIIHDPRKVFDVFISYGRRHSIDFARKLNNKLTSDGQKVWFDMNNIPLAVDFQEQIDEGIKKSDNFIFVISPHSVKSIYCLKEIILALKYNKRIIPLLHVMPDDCFDKMHPVIAKLNWIYFDGEEKFRESYKGLLSIVDSHKEYIRQHTLILNKAINWDNNQKTTSRLLVSKELQIAERWMENSGGFKNEAGEEVQSPCLPSDLHCEYVCESIKNANNLMTKAFLCYDPEDSENTEKIRTSLNRFCITIWTEAINLSSGVRLKKAKEQAIASADNFLFLISPTSVNSKVCLGQLDYAIKYRKRIIPLMIQDTDKEDIPVKLRTLPTIDFSKNIEREEIKDFDHSNIEEEVAFRKNKSDYEKDIDKIINEINKEKRYYEQHKVFLVQALKWKNQKENSSILLRGYNLENAKTWLRLGENKIHRPTSLHKEFIEESVAKSGMLNSEVFISYSRTDGDFGRKLNENLQLSGKTTWFDQESIASAADFQAEIYKGIEISSNFVFIISPDAINSPYCLGEVQHAIKNNKRIITILYRSTSSKEIPTEISSIQWIDFRSSEFHTAFGELIRTLDTDRQYIQFHTKYSQVANDWHDKANVLPNFKDSNVNNDLLLRGDEFIIAKKWIELADEENKQPPPTALQTEFINESEKRINVEKRKVNRNNIILRITLALAIIGLIVAVIFIFVATQARDKAKIQEKLAIENEKDTKEAKHKTEELLTFMIEKSIDGNKGTISGDYYKLFKQKGIEEFKKTFYRKAITNFEISSLCPDAPENYSIDHWIDRSDSCYELKKEADSLWVDGKYIEAKNFILLILDMDSIDNYAAKLNERLSHCFDLNVLVINELADKDFRKAKSHLIKMAEYNSDDKYVQEKLQLCNDEIAKEDKLRPDRFVTREKRLALVMGNGAYKYGKFVNYVNDAKSIAYILENKLGFKVIKVTSKSKLTKSKINYYIKEFGSQLNDYDVGLFYYSGKGGQIGKSAFIQPSDIDIMSESDAEKAIKVESIINTIGQSSAKTKILIIESGRNNQFSGRKNKNVIKVPQGMILAYSTSANQIADMGGGNKSKFTKALLSQIISKKTTIITVLERTKNTVKLGSGGSQLPYINSGLTIDYYLK